MRIIFINKILMFFLLLICSIRSQWIIQDNPFPQNSLNDIQIINENDIVIVGAWGTILATEDAGTTWTSISNDSTSWFNTASFISKDTGWVAGAEIIKRTNDRGLHWSTQFYTQYSFLNSVQLLNEETGWAAGYYSDDGPPLSLTYRTTNGGLDWEYVDPGISTFSWSSIFFIDGSTGWIVGGGWFTTQIIKTMDMGQTWISQLSTDGFLYSVFFINEFTGWTVGTEIATGLGLIYKTFDGGIHWTRQTVDISTILNDVFFCNENLGWAVGSEGIILSTTNSGLTWEQQYSGTNLDFNSVKFLNELEGWIVGEDGIILKTLNGGTTPVELSDFSAILQKDCVQLKWTTATEINNYGFEVQRAKSSGEFETIDFVEGYGTTSEIHSYSFIDKNLKEGIYYYRLKQVDFGGGFEYSNSILVEIVLPNVYSLDQNYPNPFNPVTTINYSVPKTSNVSLIVYDVIGREIKTLVSGEKLPGIYSVKFDGSDLSSGVYFYVLKAEGFVDTKKLVLLK